MNIGRNNKTTLMTPEQPKFPENAKSPKQPFARLDEELAAAKQRRIEEQKAYFNEMEQFLAWIGEMMAKNQVGKEPGKSLTMTSEIEDLRAAAEREEERMKGRGAAEIPRLNRLTKMLSLLKDQTFIPPEARTIEQMYDTMRSQLEDGRATLKQIEAEKD